MRNGVKLISKRNKFKRRKKTHTQKFKNKREKRTSIENMTKLK